MTRTVADFPYQKEDIDGAIEVLRYLKNESAGRTRVHLSTAINVLSIIAPHLPQSPHGLGAIIEGTRNGETERYIHIGDRAWIRENSSGKPTGYRYSEAAVISHLNGVYRVITQGVQP